jgi:hypothetical protein
MVLRYKLSVIEISHTSLSLSLEGHSGPFCYRNYIEYRLPCNPTKSGLACSAFAHRYWRNLIWFIFLALLRCFSSRRTRPNANIAPYGTNFTRGPSAKQSGFPHSETAGSKVDGTSPTSIVAVYVLPRSKSPRHPLLALVVNLYLYTPFMYSPAGDERGLDVFYPV